MASPLATQLRAIAAQLAAIASSIAAPASQPDGTMSATAKLGSTAATWTAPPSPWPIDARYLSREQIAALTPEETGRANMWQQAIMSAAITGNGQNPVPAALMIYRAGFTKSEDLGNPLDETWQRIFSVYGVPPPAPQNPRTWENITNVQRQSEAAYDVRLQGYSADNPYKTVPE